MGYYRLKVDPPGAVQFTSLALVLSSKDVLQAYGCIRSNIEAFPCEQLVQVACMYSRKQTIS